jgi:outer membrane biogenesis lipoprotein LolB
MKPAVLLALLSAAALLTGCESDMPPETNRDNPFQRGLRGDGTITTRDYSDDPFVRESSSSSY